MRRLKSWFTRFDPELHLSDVHRLPVDELAASGIKGLVFDLENTLVKYKAESLPPDVIELLDRARSTGMKVGIVSNSLRSWVDAVLAEHDIAYVGLAAKPRKKGFLKVLREMGVQPEEAFFAGDQLITDIYGAHRLGIRAALIDPIGPEGPPTTHIQRRMLVPVLNAARRLLRA